MTNEEWIMNRVEYIRGLKSPSKAQQLLVLLIEKDERTPEEEKKIKAIIRSEKARDRAREAEKNVAQILNAEKKAAKIAERKARTHRLIELGGIVEMIWKDCDKATLAGALQSALKKSHNTLQMEEWKKDGQKLLSEKKSE